MRVCSPSLAAPDTCRREANCIVSLIEPELSGQQGASVRTDDPRRRINRPLKPSLNAPWLLPPNACLNLQAQQATENEV
jgi:hypothetical protein